MTRTSKRTYFEIYTVVHTAGTSGTRKSIVQRNVRFSSWKYTSTLYIFINVVYNNWITRMNSLKARSALAHPMHGSTNFEKTCHFFLERNILRECFFNMYTKKKCEGCRDTTSNKTLDLVQLYDISSSYIHSTVTE